MRRNRSRIVPQAASAASAVNIETRFRYNQSFKSVYAMVPSVIMLMLMSDPGDHVRASAWCARRRPARSPTSTRRPITKFEFLLGKQLPYVAVAMISFVLLVLLAVFLFGVPVKGSLRDAGGRRPCSMCRQRRASAS